MSLIKANAVQLGQSGTATQNFTLAVPSSPDGTIKLARGNSGATTQDVLNVSNAGVVSFPQGLGNISNSTAIATGSTTARSLANRFADVVNVKDFGAVGDGVTDDTAAIQAAITFAGTLLTTSEVYIPSGNYRTTATLVINQSYISLIGDGSSTTIKSDFAVGDIISILGASNAVKISQIAVRDIRFIANTAQTSGSVISVVYASDVIIDNINAGFNAAYANFITIGNDAFVDSALRVFISDSSFNHSGISGTAVINLQSGAIINISNCFFNGNGNPSIACIREYGTTSNIDGLVITGCTVENFQYGIYSEDKGIVNARITDNIFDRNLYGVYLTPSVGNCNDFYFAGNNLLGDSTAGSYGIRIVARSGMERHIIADNFITNFVTKGIELVESTGSLSDVNITGNVFKNAGTVNITAGTGVDAVLVSNNIFNGNSSNNYGIEWAGTAAARIQGTNSFRGFTIANTIGTP